MEFFTFYCDIILWWNVKLHIIIYSLTAKNSETIKTSIISKVRDGNNSKEPRRAFIKTCKEHHKINFCSYVQVRLMSLSLIYIIEIPQTTSKLNLNREYTLCIQIVCWNKWLIYSIT